LENKSDARRAHYGYLFHHLVAMFQTLALQQLGKLTNPITGKLERDLHQARITIDMLQMLKEKTDGNLEHNEQALLDRALLELQMNYVDEAAREEEPLHEDEGMAKGDEEPEPAEGVAEPAKTKPEEKKAAEGKLGEEPPTGKKRTTKAAKRKTKSAPKKGGKAKKNRTPG
jgi:hypothetical protein